MHGLSRLRNERTRCD